MNTSIKDIVDEMGGVTAVSRRVGFARMTIYKWVRDNRVRYPASRELLAARGFNPDTLKKI